MNFVVVSSVGIKRIVCNGMHKISNEFEHWSDRTNGGRDMSPSLSRWLVNILQATFSVYQFQFFSQSDVLDKMSVKFETGSCGVKNRSLCQIIASCVVRYQQFPLKAYSSYTLGRLTRNLVGSFEVT